MDIWIQLMVYWYDKFALGDGLNNMNGHRCLPQRRLRHWGGLENIPTISTHRNLSGPLYTHSRLTVRILKSRLTMVTGDAHNGKTTRERSYSGVHVVHSGIKYIHGA